MTAAGASFSPEGGPMRKLGNVCCMEDVCTMLHERLHQAVQGLLALLILQERFERFVMGWTGGTCYDLLNRYLHCVIQVMFAVHHFVACFERSCLEAESSQIGCFFPKIWGGLHLPYSGLKNRVGSELREEATDLRNFFFQTGSLEASRSLTESSLRYNLPVIVRVFEPREEM